MIKKLKWFVDDQLYSDDILQEDGGSIQSDETSIDSISELLDYIEYLGMLPPIIKETIITPQYEGDEDSWIGNQDKYTPVFALQWEPEDD